MVAIKVGETKNGELMHYSVGALIARDGKYLLIDRNVPPLGFAGPAGHIDEGESAEQALKREVEEEVGMRVVSCKLLLEEEVDWNWCNSGANSHYWYLYECVVEGEIKRSEGETKSAGWYTVEEIKDLQLEPVWEYWFKKLKII